MGRRGEGGGRGEEVQGGILLPVLPPLKGEGSWRGGSFVSEAEREGGRLGFSNRTRCFAGREIQEVKTWD
jgi:hypothetical protein